MGKGFKRLWRRNVLWKNSNAGGKPNPNALPAFLKQVAEMSDEEYAAKETELLAILEENLEKVLEAREARKAAEAALQAAEAKKAPKPTPKPALKKSAPRKKIYRSTKKAKKK